ncbi:hypothetical protein [Lentilactobacillus kosonis]|uniref:Uncharacterized protein n=1 Tax=Lentilactobacillus kosonis TaxID=2810561 RepID=A0A401FMH1_9LACO|nr:hypothetical protein [Lentilactobacillus kosonis]GAY73458.1 hypothetical protein NBRC111893_1604 [Lentilactobacillus kosonis]
MPSYSQGDLSKYPGDHIKFSPFTEAYQQIKVTSNGYVEYRNITDSMETGQITNPKPISSAKITGYLIKNDTRYLYYSHHITGVPDTKVAKSGNKQYRLAITNLHQPFSMFDGDQGALLFSKYQIKNTAYFTRIGAFGV